MLDHSEMPEPSECHDNDMG